MAKWLRLDQTWCSWPSKPTALIEMIGGSYLAASPNISYKRLLNALRKKNIAIHAWSYIPSLDHQAQANEAWKGLRKCRLKLQERMGSSDFNPIRLGHSLGCKLHLIAPDCGRKCKSFIGLSFNNYNADKSIPILGKLKKKFNIETEFSPSPIETMRIIGNQYIQPKNLLIKFSNDKIDQTHLLLEHLQSRSKDETKVIELKGNHLTPATPNIREVLLDEMSNYDDRNNNFKLLIDTIYSFASE